MPNSYEPSADDNESMSDDHHDMDPDDPHTSQDSESDGSDFKEPTPKKQKKESGSVHRSTPSSTPGSTPAGPGATVRFKKNFPSRKDASQTKTNQDKTKGKKIAKAKLSATQKK